jgi:hypothetical protein
MAKLTQVSLQLTQAQIKQIQDLQAAGFGTRTDIVRIAVDRIHNQEIRSEVNTMNWQKYIDEMIEEAKQKNVEVRGFHVGGGNGIVFQAEGWSMSVAFDTVSGDYVAGSDFIKNSPEQEDFNYLSDRINEWVDEPLFWASEESPESYVN